MISLLNRGLQIAARESGQQASVIRTLPDKRGFFKAQELKITFFQARSEKLEKNEAINLDKIRSSINEAISKPDSFPKRLDVDNFIHLAKSDADLELGSKAVEHLNTRLNRTQRLLLGSNLARAYYMQNKTDKAIELYGNKNGKTFDAPDLAGLILLNKLVEEKRFDDAISFYERVVNNNVADLDKKKLIGYLELYLEALLEKNTPESLQKAKTATDAFKSKLTFDKLRSSLFKIILLAVNQNDAAYALQLLSAAKNEDPVASNRVFINLKLIALLKNKQAKEFIQEADQMKSKQFREGGHFFPETIEQVKSFADTLTDENLKKSLHEIAQTPSDKLIQGDLKSVILKKSILTERQEGDEKRVKSDGVQRNNQRRPNQNRNNENNNYAQSRRNDDGFQNRDRYDSRNNRDNRKSGSYVNRRNDGDEERRDSRSFNRRPRNDDSDDNQGFANPPRRN